GVGSRQDGAGVLHAPDDRVLQTGDSLAIRDPGREELVVRSVPDDHEVGPESQPHPLEKAAALHPGPARHAGVDDLDLARRVTSAQQLLQAPGERRVLIDAEAEGDRVADAEDAVRAVVLRRERSLGTAK